MNSRHLQKQKHFCIEAGTSHIRHLGFSVLLFAAKPISTPDPKVLFHCPLSGAWLRTSIAVVFDAIPYISSARVSDPRRRDLHPFSFKMVSASFKPHVPFLFTQLLLSFSTVIHGRKNCSPQSCKVIPGDANWPSQASWARFNESLGGGLLQPAPPGAVCHQGQRTYDPDQCPVVVDGWSSYEFHAEHPTSSQWNQFSNDSCLPDPSYPCDASGYPTFVVNATETKHVQAAVNFGELQKKEERENRLSLKLVNAS